MSDTPETQEAVERWQQGKINISDNAVDVAEVGNGGAAIAWLEKRDTRALRAREMGRIAA